MLGNPNTWQRQIDLPEFKTRSRLTRAEELGRPV